MPTVQTNIGGTSAPNPNRPGGPSPLNVEHKDVNVSYKGGMNAVAERVLITYNEEENFLVKVLLCQFRYDFLFLSIMFL